ncbi:MAG TPA: DMT family transporter [Candidatus Krumholzibacteria bacterium]|nr:DMT family transporter [Candidatus Krumholzibacteria bacterium]
MSIHAVRDRGAAVSGRRPRLAPLAGLLSAGTLLGLSTNLVKHAADQGLDPLILLTWSVAGAGLAVSIVNAVAGRAPRPGRRNTAYFAIAALLGVVTPNLLLYAAVPRVGAGFATLAIAFPPLLTYLGALALRMESFDARRAAGVGVALAGAIYLAYRKVAAPEAPIAWIAAVMVVPAILAAGNLYRTARWPADARPEDLAPGVLLVAGATLFAIATVTGVPLAAPLRGEAPILPIVLQIGLLSAQTLIFFNLQKNGGPVLTSLLGSVAAVVGVPAAVLLLNEPPPAGLAIGGISIAAGIALLVSSSGSRAPS